MFTRLRTLALPWQFAVCIGLVALVALLCHLVSGTFGYRDTALVLLMTVSVLAALFAPGPVLAAAAVSALAWNWFFIPPVFTLHIGSTADGLMFLAYFFVALVNAVLTLKIRQAERRARDKDEQARAVALYDTLLNSLSHELRTPITTIVGAVDALRNDTIRLSPAQRDELLAEIDTASGRLDHQVGDLLGMGRLESGMLRPRLDWCDVNETIGGVITELHRPDDGRIVFRPDPALPLFKLDGGLLAHVLHNLLLNALRYTPDGTPIRIAAEHADDACTITVADEGPGFPSGEAERAFQKFHRVPGTHGGGTGLGLSIVQGFVQAQGGHVTLRPNTPHGAIFTVILPAEASFLSNLKHD